MTDNGAVPSPEQVKEHGMHLFARGERAGALEQFRLAEKAFREAGDAGMAYEMLNNQGVIHRLQRDWPAATAALRAAGEGFASIGDHAREGQALANLGDVHAALGQRDEAERYYGRAAERLAAADDRDRQAQVLRAMSLAQLRQGHFWAAVTLMEHSLTVRRNRGPFGWLFRWLLRFAMRLLAGR